MNSHAAYRRHAYRAAEPTAPTHAPQSVTSELAYHRDPSLSPNRPPTSTAKSLAWVRPTELAAYSTPLVGRGVDLQAELIRRSRRTPSTTARVLQRGIPHSPAATPSTTRTEGPSL